MPLSVNLGNDFTGANAGFYSVAFLVSSSGLQLGGRFGLFPGFFGYRGRFLFEGLRGLRLGIGM